jgi:hypothetical protein
MRTFRFVALLPLAAAACYSDSPAQSTLPTTPFADEPRYTQGPPGGAMDEDPRTDAYAPNPGFAASDDDDDDDAPQASAPPAPSADPGPAEGLVEPAPAVDPDDVAVAPSWPGGPAIAGGPGLAGPVDPSAPVEAGAPTAGVTDVEINATLDGYGEWVDTEDYGPVWRPDATVVGVDFTPYETAGSWAYTDAGWAFASDYNWGWLPFHYGRWAWFEDSWGWVPGHRWSPAWVDWRCGGGVTGWRPRMPHPRSPNDPNRAHHHYGRGELMRDGRRAQVHDGHWRFAADRDFGRPHIRSHLYGNTAEGLRLTSRVQAPSYRARTTLRANDVMRDRYSVRRYGAPTQQGYRQPQRVQRYAPGQTYQRPSNPGRAYQRPYTPGQSYQRPERYAPQGSWSNRPAPGSPGRVWTAPNRPTTAPGRVWTSPNRPSGPPPRMWGGPPSRTGNGSHTGGGPGAPPSGFHSGGSTGNGSHTGGGPGAPPSGFHSGGSTGSHSSSSGGHSGGGGGGGHSGGGGGGSHNGGGFHSGSRGR